MIKVLSMSRSKGHRLMHTEITAGAKFWLLGQPLSVITGDVFTCLLLLGLLTRTLGPRLISWTLVSFWLRSCSWIAGYWSAGWPGEGQQGGACQGRLNDRSPSIPGYIMTGRSGQDWGCREGEKTCVLTTRVARPREYDETKLALRS